MAAIKEALVNLHSSENPPDDTTSPAPSLGTISSPAPEGSEPQFNDHEMAAIKEALVNLHGGEISDQIIDMGLRGGQSTFELNRDDELPSYRSEKFSDQKIKTLVERGRKSAWEDSRGSRIDEDFPDELRANCRNSDSCSDLRNLIGEGLASGSEETAYTNPGRPIEGTNSYPVPPFPGKCWRKDPNDGNKVKEFPAGHEICDSPFSISGGKARLSRRSGKKKSSPSRMSRRTRRSRRSTRKAGRKGRRSTRRSRK